MSILGTRVLRIEDPRLLTEGATYLADLRDPRLDGAVHATFVRSTVAHARLLGVDASGARDLPGVVDVVTGADVDLAPIAGMTNPAMARPYLAVDRVRFVGEPVAVVLTERPEQGPDAVEAVLVDYDPLPAVVDPLDALRGDVVLHPDIGTNLVGKFGEGPGTDGDPGDGDPGDRESGDGAPREGAPGHSGTGDTGTGDGGESAGERVVVRQRLVNQRLAACPLEVRSSAAAWVDGRLVLWCSTQNAHGVRASLVGAYGLADGDVHVITPDVGGGFGGKIGAHPEDLVLGWLARRCGCPVRWVETRSENMMAMVHGRAQVHDVTLTGRADGMIEAYHLSVVQDAGAYPAMAAMLPLFTRMMAAGTYAIPQVTSDARIAATTTTPTGAYRGAGRPEATAAIERAVDLFAAEIGMDPADVRRRNLLRPFDQPHTTPTGATYDCGDYPAALERVLEAAGYDDLRAEQARRRAAGDPVALGIGVSTYVEITGGPGPGSEYGRVEVRPAAPGAADGGAAPANAEPAPAEAGAAPTDPGTATPDAVPARADGGVEVVVTTGASPHGQGLDTALAMLVSDELGVPVDAVRVVHGDTDVVPRATGTFASRSLQLAGSAVRGAAAKLVERARQVAADLLEAAVDDVVLDTAAGRFHVAGTPSVSRSWAEVAAAAAASCTARATGAPGALDADRVASAGARLAAESDSATPQSTYPFGAHVAVVEVDTETGDARLVRLVACDDAGRIVNPLLAEGQRHGGLAQGAAQALYEQVAYDPDGNPLTTTFADHAIVSAAELPSFELVGMETPTWVNPLGAKGIGESGTIGATPAVHNAVCDALTHRGVRHVDMPCTPERVWRAIGEAAERSPG